MSQEEQYTKFNDNLETLLEELSCFNYDSYVFSDVNINLLSIATNGAARNYAGAVLNNGFIFTNFKASRMCNDLSTLIDHIITNSKSVKLTSGSVIEDISDHWVTFIQPNLTKKKSKAKVTQRRIMSNVNLERFKTHLASVPWDEVLAEMDVDACYNKFWDIYKTLYDLNFPLTTVRFNKNIQRISTFMTEGLLVSRRNKIKLLKMYLVDRTDQKKSKYVEYRNLYVK
jgi:hypothetical protein